MTDWFSSRELAGVPGMPSSVGGTIRKGKKECWQSRPRTGRGGGFEYHISSLPKETQQALAVKATNEKLKALETDPVVQAGKVEAAKVRIKVETEKKVAATNRQASLIKSEGLLPMAKTRMNAKLEIIKLMALFKANSNESATASQFRFCALYNNFQIEVPGWIREAIKTVSQGSLMRWIKTVKKEGITKLSGQYGNKRGSGLIDRNEALRNLVVSMINDFPLCDAKHVFQGACARHEELGCEIPSLKTFARWMAAWKEENKQVFTAIKNPDEFRNQFQVAAGNAAEQVVRYLQLWEMDSTPADIMLTDGRHTIIGNIDVWSRRFKLRVSKSSKAVQVGLLIRDAMLSWGVPEVIKTDNGSDYVSNYIVSTLQALEIEQKLCPPFQPQKKPHIERAFRTFSHGLLELMPGFIGHNVAERKDIEARKSFADRLMKRGETIEISLSAKELQEFCDKWTDKIYFYEKHRTLKMTPFAKVQSWSEETRTIEDVRALDILLAEAPSNNGERVVTKKGINVDNFSYIAPELMAYIGFKVKVRYEPLDAGKIIVYTPAMDLICVAECPEITGVPRLELATVATATQKKLISARKAELTAISRSTKTKNIASEILQNLSDNADKIVGIPKATTAYTPEALQAAADAVIVMDEISNEPTTFEEIDAAGKEDLPVDGEKKLAKIFKLEFAHDVAEDEKKARIKRYEALLAKNFIGISEEDDIWRKGWETTGEYRVWAMMRKSFGPCANKA